MGGILGIDAATRTGWAHSDGMFGAFQFDAGAPSSAKVGLAYRNGFILARAISDIGALMDRLEPTLIGVEAPFSRGAGTRLLYALVGVVQAMAAQRGIPIIYEEPAAVRKLVLGHGDAEKADTLIWARGQGHVLTDSETDEADAFLVVEAARLRAITPRVRKKPKSRAKTKPDIKSAKQVKATRATKHTKVTRPK